MCKYGVTYHSAGCENDWSACVRGMLRTGRAEGSRACHGNEKFTAVLLQTVRSSMTRRKARKDFTYTGIIVEFANQDFKLTPYDSEMTSYERVTIGDVDYEDPLPV